MRSLFILLVLTPTVALGQAPHPNRPRPALTDPEVRPPNHVLTPANKEKFVTTEFVPVGENLVIVLPVQSGVAYRWRFEPPKDTNDLATFTKALRRLYPPGSETRDDVRAIRKGFETQAGGLLGKVDALQVFKFEAVAPADRVPIRFRLVGVADDAPSEVVFEARVRTRLRPPVDGPPSSR